VNAETVALVKSPAVSTQVRNVVAAAVVEIHGQQYTIRPDAHFEHELFLSLHLHDSVGIPEDV
jgi:hypothetical protein